MKTAVFRWKLQLVVRCFNSWKEYRRGADEPQRVRLPPGAKKAKRGKKGKHADAAPSEGKRGRGRKAKDAAATDDASSAPGEGKDAKVDEDGDADLAGGGSSASSEEPSKGGRGRKRKRGDGDESKDTVDALVAEGAEPEPKKAKGSLKMFPGAHSFTIYAEPCCAQASAGCATWATRAT